MPVQNKTIPSSLVFPLERGTITTWTTLVSSCPIKGAHRNLVFLIFPYITLGDSRHLSQSTPQSLTQQWTSPAGNPSPRTSISSNPHRHRTSTRIQEPVPPHPTSSPPSYNPSRFSNSSSRSSNSTLPPCKSTPTPLDGHRRKQPFPPPAAAMALFPPDKARKTCGDPPLPVPIPAICSRRAMWL